MEPVAEFRVLLGIDLIESARTPAHHLAELPKVLSRLLVAALERVGIGEAAVIDRQYTGDGWLLAFPSALLGAVVDLSRHLDELAAEHNRWQKPEVRMRIAVEIGPLPAEPGFYQANISRGRLLDAQVFKGVVRRCSDERPDGSLTSGLILSDYVFRTVFGGDYTQRVRRTEFAPVRVSNKEYEVAAWVAVPGFDVQSLARMVDGDPAQPLVEPQVAEVGVVNNHITGDNKGVQAHTIHGGVSFGR
ncbi:hypothetical protein GCM10010174_43630 [Kutzneria viridogrisea]|uniref:Guanylate cyclase domain-containing protein n=2 Tax=Kutzneria TaxID=43356 RepID=W5W5K9_9PSEU|nr:hypothetical protein [Kutzneria albida]AHH96162.1 hypothetical protein KALB_2794 [Kutzneria albida DSM 43870]MBA8928626.1 hypothetical protein [Kutzneria viridogrisea]